MTGYANGDIAIAVCGRCKMKRPYTALGPDPNFHGLRVCIDSGVGTTDSCADQFDPYRLPPRQTEAITMRFPRPDVSIAPSTLYIVTDDDALIETEDGAWIVIAPGS